MLPTCLARVLFFLMSYPTTIVLFPVFPRGSPKIRTAFSITSFRASLSARPPNPCRIPDPSFQTLNNSDYFLLLGHRCFFSCMSSLGSVLLKQMVGPTLSAVVFFLYRFWRFFLALFFPALCGNVPSEHSSPSQEVPAVMTVK